MNRVIKVETDRYTVDMDGQTVTCYARKKVKRNSDIVVGDFVELENSDGVLSVKKVLERKNSLIRPSIANIDNIIMTIAPVPEPDFYLVDKMHINCARRNIGFIICVNKTDLDDTFLNKVQDQYGADVKIISTCAKDNDISQLTDALKGKFSCLAGQSAVGKSSIVNALHGEKIAKSGELSAINRGRNTTTRATLYKLDESTFVADTPGFGLLDVFDVEYDELDLYYSEYVELSMSCKYHRCKHINEPGCEVKKRVEEGSVSKDRYLRYVETYNELKNKKKKY
ncbi:MAG: ribosome small subunit-dependent GTPase A [Clostridia bacterium]|nr:ribosome small subunit-dependent GTPase A [Clostridia bacterium]